MHNYGKYAGSKLNQGVCKLIFEKDRLGNNCYCLPQFSDDGGNYKNKTKDVINQMFS